MESCEYITDGKAIDGDEDLEGRELPFPAGPRPLNDRWRLWVAAPYHGGGGGGRGCPSFTEELVRDVTVSVLPHAGLVPLETL